MALNNYADTNILKMEWKLIYHKFQPQNVLSAAQIGWRKRTFILLKICEFIPNG